MKDNINFQKDSADVVSCDYFQGYSGVERAFGTIQRIF
jgi:hypothetical protein